MFDALSFLYGFMSSLASPMFKSVADCLAQDFSSPFPLVLDIDIEIQRRDE